MKRLSNIQLIEILLIALVWSVLVAAPYLFGGEARFASWQSLLRPFEVLLPAFLVFVVNRAVLVPRLLLRRKYLAYIASVAALIAFFTLGLITYRQTVAPDPFPPRQEQPGPRPMPPFANLLITSVLLVGFDTGLRVSMRALKTEREKEALEKENIQNQLAFLQHQISPHFFMNTLNNIHTLVDINAEQAKDAILRLSKMMRYLLYDTAHGSTTLKKEVEFVESYIELMRLRVSGKVEIRLDLPDHMPDVQIPPVLFIPFIENAFKHGVSYRQPSFVHIALRIEDEQIHFHIENSIAPVSPQEASSGIGIENVRRRLDLLNGTDYKLEIFSSRDTFRVNLFIPKNSYP